MKNLLLTLAAAAVILPGSISHAAPPFRLNEIGAARFVERSPGAVWLERGLLSSLGKFRVTEESPVLVSVPVPDDAKNKLLVQLEAWFAYERLGDEAVANFIADLDTPAYTIGLRQYMTVRPSPNARLDGGRLINISSRARVSGSEKLLAGFVVDEQHRWVLVRAVGPGLSDFGVNDALPDPYLTIYKSNTIVHYNGDWSTRPDATDIASAAQRAGAFPLRTGSKDSALLIELPPGAYTAHVEPESAGAGQVLLEIYSVENS